MRTESEFRALLVLLADDDDRVASVAWQALFQAGESALPFLAEAANAPNPRLRGRARLLLEDLRTANLETRWARYCAQPDAALDLLEGCLILSGLVREVDAGSVTGFLEAMAGMVRAHMVGSAPMAALGEVLFENLGFKGGEYEEPDNYFLVPALERRTGIPIVLSTLYVLVGKEIGLPVAGVAAPKHYLARVETPDGPFFVDCYNRGRIYREETLISWLAGRGLKAGDQFLEPCGNRLTLLRMMNNMERVYAETVNDARMATVVRRMRGYLENR